MNDIAIEKTMTIKEVADVLAVSEDTVTRAVNSLYPGLVKNGVRTYLNEAQVACVNKHINSNRQLRNPAEVSTDIEMSAMTVKVLQFHIGKIKQLEQANETLLIERQIMLPKVETAEALARCDTNMSITETAKHFGLHPKKQVFPFLRAKGLLTYRDLPTQTAIDRGIMTVRQNPVGDGDFYTQAVVEKSALDMWRTTIVPRIIEWSETMLNLEEVNR